MKQRRAQRSKQRQERDEAVLLLSVSAVLLLGILWPV
jgi:hypothetical protein